LVFAYSPGFGTWHVRLREGFLSFAFITHGGSPLINWKVLVGALQEVIFLDIAFPTLIFVENIVSVFYEGIFLDVTFPLLILVKNIEPVRPGIFLDVPFRC
jgi:hypothetical protein